MYYDHWRYRRFLGLTQQAVSYATGIPVQRIAASERGKVILNRTELCLIARYLTDKILQLAEAREFYIPANGSSLEVAHV